VPHQSAEAMGRGGAVTAASEKADAAFYNPAALAFSAQQGLVATANVVLSGTRFDPADGSPDVQTRRGFPVPIPSLFAHRAVHPRVQLALALSIPFGFSVRWPEGWQGAQQSLESSIVVAAANPSVAYRVNDWLSLAGGLSLLRGSLALGLALPEPAGGRADLEGNAWGFTFNAAALVRLMQGRLRAGLSFRRGTALSFSGQADFEPEAQAFVPTLPDQPGRARVPLPDVVSLGLAVQATAALALSADVSLARWSTLQDLVVDLDSFDPVQRREAQDAFSLALGAQRAFGKRLERLTIRAGFRFEQSLSPPRDVSSSTPDSHRLGISLGAGWAFDSVQVDVAYLFSRFLPTTVDNPAAGPLGTYDSTIQRLMVSLGAASNTTARAASERSP